MIIDELGTRAISSLGWADRGGFVVAEFEGRTAVSVPVEDATFVDVHGGRDGIVALQHHDNRGATTALSLRRIGDPGVAIAAVMLGRDGEAGPAAFSGDAGAWHSAPNGYVATIWTSTQEYRLLTIDPAALTVTAHHLPWFNDAFDSAYQAPSEAVAVPGTSTLFALAVVRDARLFVHDIATGKLARTVQLADRGGAHVPHFQSEIPQAWTTDYDAIVCIDPRTWAVAHTQKLQRPAADVAMFLGRVSLTADEALCVLPRPGSGDVLGIDTATRRVVRRAVVGMQPIEAVASPSGVVHARDWKSGASLWAEWTVV